MRTEAEGAGMLAQAWGPKGCCSAAPGAGGGRKDPPPQPPEGTWPCLQLDFLHLGLQSWESIRFSVCKLPGWWYFLTVTPGKYCVPNSVHTLSVPVPQTCLSIRSQGSL